jgi:hypothetical protein
MCLRHSKNKNAYNLLDFDTQIFFKNIYSFKFVIMVQNKVIDLTIM